MPTPRLIAPLALVVAASIALAGCAGEPAAETAPSGAAGVTPDPAAVDLLPADIVDAGELVVGTDTTYAPNEFADADGEPAGWEIDLADALAAKLGLTVDYEVAKFDTIIPGIAAEEYDLGVSSIFDTVERQETVDLVDYYTTGIRWVTPEGSELDPATTCGITLAVQNGTTEALTDGPAKSKACVDSGQAAIQLLGYDTQDDVTAAVTSGRADAMAADSPVAQHAVAESDGALQLSGDTYDEFAYGIAVAKDRGTLADAVQSALQSLVDDGTYGDILDDWGVGDGAVEEIVINGATA